MSRIIMPPGYEPRVARRSQLAPPPDPEAARAFVEGFVGAHAESEGISWESAAEDIMRRAPEEKRAKLSAAIETMKRERSANGRTLIRVKIARGDESDGGNIEWGEVKIRPMIDLDNVVLCQQFGFDSDRFVFDLPSSAGGTGSTSSGTRGNLEINGYVLHRDDQGRPDRNRSPVATVEFLRDGKQFADRDIDPTNRSDFERLG